MAAKFILRAMVATFIRPYVGGLSERSFRCQYFLTNKVLCRVSQHGKLFGIEELPVSLSRDMDFHFPKKFSNGMTTVLRDNSY